MKQKVFDQSSRLMWKWYNDNKLIAKSRLQILCANCNWIKRYDTIKIPTYEKILNLKNRKSKSFINHVCNNESNCPICKEYINETN